MRYQGKITGWNDAKGYGFVMPNGGGTKAFIHIKSFRGRSIRPADNELITYELSHDSQRRPVAKNIQFALHKQSPSSKTGWTGSLSAGVFLTFVWLVVLEQLLPVEVAWLYSGASLITFIMYALDKSAARNGNDRTPEAHLQGLALIGGWPGALLVRITDKCSHSFQTKVATCFN